MAHRRRRRPQCRRRPNRVGRRARNPRRLRRRRATAIAVANIATTAAIRTPTDRHTAVVQIWTVMNQISAAAV